MEHIKLHINGDIEMRTITVSDLTFILMKNGNNEKWIAQTRKIRSFKEIQLADKIKTTFLHSTE